MKVYPPRWADRFLHWYCNPDLLEEIQGDALELYQQRLVRNRKTIADLMYVWDIICFFRWSNIKFERGLSLRSALAIVRFNTRISLRNANRGRSMFAIKTFALALSLSFAFIMLVYLIQEYSSDRFHSDFSRIYRVTSFVRFSDRATHYAVTPFPLGAVLVDNLTSLESYTRFIHPEKPLFTLDNDHFSNVRVLVADSNFLRIFTFEVLAGDRNSLRQPGNIVITDLLAQRWFGESNPIGKTMVYGSDVYMEVAAVVKAPPPGSHLQFDALIAWDSFEHYDEWGNLNAYTYIKLAPDATIEEVEKKVSPVIQDLHELIAREYNAVYEPRFENLTDIHFSKNLDEDIATKKGRQELWMVTFVVLLLLVTGLINYFNISLVQLSGQAKRVIIQNIFGGTRSSAWRAAMSDTLVNVMITIPLAALLVVVSYQTIEEYFGLRFGFSSLSWEMYVFIVILLVLIHLMFTMLNAAALSRVGVLLTSISHSWSSRTWGVGFRTTLVGAQIAFSVVMISLVFVVGDQMKFIRSADKGFDDQNTLIVKLRNADAAGISAFKEKLSHNAGIISIDESSYYPGQVESKWVFEVETDEGIKQMLVPMMRCGSKFIETLDIPLVEGRSFTESKVDKQHAFVINETAARFFNWQKSLGKRIRGPVGGENEAYKDGYVVGVVKDFHFGTMHGPIEPLIVFLSDDNWPGDYIYIKYSTGSSTLDAIQNAFSASWPGVPFEYEFLDSKYESLYAADDQLFKVFQISWIISILLSSLGVFGISALLISLRLKEIGLRKVLGATAFDLLILHWKRLAIILSISIITAVPVSWIVTAEWLNTYAYHIQLKFWHFAIPAFLSISIAGFVSLYNSLVGHVWLRQ